MKWIVFEIDEYWINDLLGGMLLLIDWFFGYDKWWIILNLFGFFFLIKFSGEYCKLENGLFLKGFWILLVEIFFCIFWLIIFGFVRVEFKFFDFILGYFLIKFK